MKNQLEKSKTLIENAKRILKDHFQSPDIISSHPDWIGLYPTTTYQATQVTSRLYAAPGPGTAMELKKFNIFLFENRIKNIIALGEEIGEDKDFINYGYFKDKDPVEVQCLFEVGIVYQLKLSDENHALTRPNFLKSGILFGVIDGKYIETTEKSLILHNLYTAYLQSLSGNTLMHCRNATGRTGHMIMTFLYFELFFFGERRGLVITTMGPDKLAEYFLNILDAVRSLKCCFVHGNLQLLAAVDNAFNLYQYVYGKGFDKFLLAHKPHLDEICGYKYSFETGYFEIAIEEKAKEHAHDDYIQRGIDSLNQGELDRALMNSTKAIRLNPFSVKALLLRARIYARQDHTLDLVFTYEKIFQYSNCFNTLRCETSFDHFPVYAVLGIIEKYTFTINHRQGRIIAKTELDKDLFEAYMMRGDAHLTLYQNSQARDDFVNACKLNPHSYEAFFKRGYAHAKLGYVDDAITSYREAITINPKSIEAKFNIAVNYEICGMLSEAIDHYNMVTNDCKEFVRRSYQKTHLDYLTSASLNLIRIYTDNNKNIPCAMATQDQLIDCYVQVLKILNRIDSNIYYHIIKIFNINTHASEVRYLDFFRFVAGLFTADQLRDIHKECPRFYELVKTTVSIEKRLAVCFVEEISEEVCKAKINLQSKDADQKKEAEEITLKFIEKKEKMKMQPQGINQPRRWLKESASSHVKTTTLMEMKSQSSHELSTSIVSNKNLKTKLDDIEWCTDRIEYYSVFMEQKDDEAIEYREKLLKERLKLAELYSEIGKKKEAIDQLQATIDEWLEDNVADEEPDQASYRQFARMCNQCGMIYISLAGDDNFKNALDKFYYAFKYHSAIVSDEKEIPLPACVKNFTSEQLEFVKNHYLEFYQAITQSALNPEHRSSKLLRPSSPLLWEGSSIESAVHNEVSDHEILETLTL